MMAQRVVHDACGWAGAAHDGAKCGAWCMWLEKVQCVTAQDMMHEHEVQKHVWHEVHGCMRGACRVQGAGRVGARVV